MTTEKPEARSAIFRSDSASTLEDLLAPAFATDIQAADYLGLTPHQLYLHRRRGTGPPFVQHGVRTRYPIAELVEWAKNLPRFTSRAQAYVADPERAVSALRQRTATAKARKTRWRKEAEVAPSDSASG
jgi:hypothetical protein